MSGGFFRGTSADQDTRFSNKQAKLLKSQKFAPELDHLVDMTKVKMDVIRPWIATRATELLGFEDEVLINFVYGLLDVKVVDGKKIQIQLTGFMEKNTGKFMKELWILLLSAQNNVSGVPQQFLDAKEDEQRKKKEENEKISQEIQRRKERAGRDLEREKLARMDGEEIDTKFRRAGLDLVSRPRDYVDQLEEDRKVDATHALKTSNGQFKSPNRKNPSPSPQRSSPSPAKPSIRSVSRENRGLRSSSPYSQSPRQSISPKKQKPTSARLSSPPIRQYRSAVRDSISRSPTPSIQHKSPRRHSSRSPVRRRSPHSRRRSNSNSPDLYTSSYYRRSHARRRSPYTSCRSPPQRRSLSPVRRRSPPLRRNSPSPVHRRPRSPPRHRSPMHFQRKSPARYTSTSPIRRSPIPLPSKLRKQSPFKSPVRGRADSHSSLRQRTRSPSPLKRESPLNRRRLHKTHNNFMLRSPSPHKRESLLSRKGLHSAQNNLIESGIFGRLQDERAQQRLSTSFEKELSNYVSAGKSPSHSKYQGGKRISLRELSRSVSPCRSPVIGRGGSSSHHDSSEASREERRTIARDASPHKNKITHKQLSYSCLVEDSYVSENSCDTLSPERPAAQISAARQLKSEIKFSGMENRYKGIQLQEDIEYGPGGTRGGRNQLADDIPYSLDKSPERRAKKECDISSKVHHSAENSRYMSKHNEPEETLAKEHGRNSKRKFVQDHLLNSDCSDSYNEQNSEKQQSVTSENDSQVDNKKEAKRKRKEEKRLIRKEKRRVREERRRRRSERRAARQKVRSTDVLSPFLGLEKHFSGADDSDVDVHRRKSSHTSEAKEADSEQKRLEIELRKKALESLRAKKAIND